MKTEEGPYRVRMLSFHSKPEMLRENELRKSANHIIAVLEEILDAEEMHPKEAWEKWSHAVDAGVLEIRTHVRYADDRRRAIQALELGSAWGEYAISGCYTNEVTVEEIERHMGWAVRHIADAFMIASIRPKTSFPKEKKEPTP